MAASCMTQQPPCLSHALRAEEQPVQSRRVSLHTSQRFQLPGPQTYAGRYIRPAGSSTQMTASTAADNETELIDDADLYIDEVDGEFDEELSFSTTSDDVGPGIEAGSTAWGQKALEVAQRVLSTPEMAGLELYSFRAIATGSTLDIRLDKLEDRFGSPMLEEIESFSRSFQAVLEAELGEEVAGAISLEVSSPGAERLLRLPHELERFKELPMSVTYSLPESSGGSSSRVLQLGHVNESQEVSVWQLANVRENRPGGKGTRLTKKQSQERFEIPIKELQQVKLYIEI